MSQARGASGSCRRRERRETEPPRDALPRCVRHRGNATAGAAVATDRKKIPPTHRLQQVRPALQLTSSHRRRGLPEPAPAQAFARAPIAVPAAKARRGHGEPHRRSPTERAGCYAHPPQRHRHHHRPCGHATGARTTRVRTVRARRAETKRYPAEWRPRPPGSSCLAYPSWERRRGRACRTSVRCGARNQVTSEAAAAPAAKRTPARSRRHRTAPCFRGDYYRPQVAHLVCGGVRHPTLRVNRQERPKVPRAAATARRAPACWNPSL